MRVQVLDVNEQFIKLLPSCHSYCYCCSLLSSMRFGHSIFRIPVESNKIYSKLFANDNDSLDRFERQNHRQKHISHTQNRTHSIHKLLLMLLDCVFHFMYAPCITFLCCVPERISLVLVRSFLLSCLSLALSESVD